MKCNMHGMDAAAIGCKFILWLLKLLLLVACVSCFVVISCQRRKKTEILKERKKKKKNVLRSGWSIARATQRRCQGTRFFRLWLNDYENYELKAQYTFKHLSLCGLNAKTTESMWLFVCKAWNVFFSVVHFYHVQWADFTSVIMCIMNEIMSIRKWLYWCSCSLLAHNQSPPLKQKATRTQSNRYQHLLLFLFDFLSFRHQSAYVRYFRTLMS